MPAQRMERVFASLDVGSSKVCALIAGVKEDGEMVVLGTGQRASKSVRRGYVADIDTTELAVRDAVEQAEQIAGVSIEEVWVALSAGALSSDVTRVESDLGGHRVEQDDIDYLLEAGRDAIDPKGKLVLHAQPAVYTLDGLSGVKQPKGLHADRLGVSIHVLLADSAPVRNIDSCVRAAHLDVRGIVAAPIAAGLACLSEEECDLGVALVEIGAGVTNVALYEGGMLTELATIELGAGDITDAIASAFGISRAEAERIKCFHGSATQSPHDNREVIDLDRRDSGGEAPRITRAQLNSVIRQQLDLLVAEIKKALDDMGFASSTGRQVVLTGGGAELTGIADYAQAALGRAVRTGRPAGLASLPEAHSGPAFATLAGLALYANSDMIDLRFHEKDEQTTHHFAGGAFMARVLRAIRANF